MTDAPRRKSGALCEWRERKIERSSDGAEEFVFVDVNFTVGKDNRHRGVQEALLDGQTRAREPIECGIERGEIGGGRGFA